MKWGNVGWRLLRVRMLKGRMLKHAFGPIFPTRAAARKAKAIAEETR